MNESTTTVPVRGFLLHITHYDPKWCPVKDQEQPFDLPSAIAIIDAMATRKINTLIVDCADGVIYKSHPELKRHYTVPMDILAELSRYAAGKNIDIVPKLNFSQSRFYLHNHWMYPHNENINGRDIFDMPEYWEIAFELIDELIDACRPQRFFHIGMDEDHDRSHTQFAAAINTLAAGLKQRGLRTVMWRDTRTDPRGRVFSEKQDAVEDALPRDIVLMVWGYEGMADTETIARLLEKKFEIWIGTAGWKPNPAGKWNELLASINYRTKPNTIITNWMPCTPGNRDILRAMIMAE